MNLTHNFFRLIGAFCLLALVTSCGEDEEIVDREPLIIGVWTLESQDITNVSASASGIGNIPIPESIVNSFVDTLTIIPENSEFTFNQDRTYRVRTPQQNSDFSGTWALSDDQNTITLSGLEAAEALLGSNSLVFVILSISDTNFSVNTSSSEITLPNLPTVGTVTGSGDYQLNLVK
jgi:hypothetical protein